MKRTSLIRVDDLFKNELTLIASSKQTSLVDASKDLAELLKDLRRKRGSLF